MGIHIRWLSERVTVHECHASAANMLSRLLTKSSSELRAESNHLSMQFDADRSECVECSLVQIPLDENAYSTWMPLPLGVAVCLEM